MKQSVLIPFRVLTFFRLKHFTIKYQVHRAVLIPFRVLTFFRLDK